MYEFDWIGYCGTNGHDKIWGVMKTSSGAYYSFWAGRNKSFQFKRLSDRWEARELCNTKSSKKKDPYKQQSIANICLLFNDFVGKFENDYAIAKLSGKIRTEDQGSFV